MTATVRTVLGDAEALSLGITNSHEHVIIRNGLIVAQEPDFRLDSIEKSIEELRDFRSFGRGTVVDTAPIGIVDASTLNTSLQMSKTYLITGASGIGAETAKQLVQAEHCANSVQLFIAAREKDKCEAHTHELRALGAAFEYRSGVLTDPEFAPQLMADCVSRFGRLDCLFNVAGISGRRFGDGPAHECTEEAWAITINTNLTTQYRMSREAIRIMLNQPIIGNGQRGVILNMSSILALIRNQNTSTRWHRPQAGINFGDEPYNRCFLRKGEDPCPT